MSFALTLESFEDEISSDTTVSPDYSQGYQDGLEAGLATAQTEVGALDEALIQSISDVKFTYAEARGQILQSLGPLFATLVDKILPQCVASGFATRVAAMLTDIAQQDADVAITLHLHPESLPLVESRVAEIGADILSKPDASLTAHAAWVLHGRSETHLDIDGLLKEIAATLDVLNFEKNRNENHG